MDKISSIGDTQLTSRVNPSLPSNQREPATSQRPLMGHSLIFLTLALATGCTTDGSKGGLWEKLEAMKLDSSFYLAKYVGTQEGCFPPITNVECFPLKNGEVIYEDKKKLEMEAFSISLAFRDFFDQSRIKDLLFLAASELALQRGFSMFTVITKIDVSVCKKYGFNANTNGSAYRIGDQDYYSGTTTITPRDTCTSSESITVLMFNDKTLLADGIFTRANSGPTQWLQPETRLYFGTMPGLRYEDFNRQPFIDSRVSTPINAWKIHYDARGLATDLRAKYKLGEPVSIQFRDELAENLKREAADPLKRNRVISP